MDNADEWFTGIYRALHPRVLAYARRRVDYESAQQATDEAFLITWRKRDVVPKNAVLPWILTTTRHILSDRYRRDRRYDQLTIELDRAHRDLAENRTDHQALERAAVLSALGQLSRQNREILFMTVWDGLSQKDAAAVLGCSVPTFAVRLHRARRKLTSALEDQEVSDQPAAKQTSRPFNHHRTSPPVVIGK